MPRMGVDQSLDCRAERHGSECHARPLNIFSSLFCHCDCHALRRAQRAASKRDANISLVHEAMNRWRLQNDPAANLPEEQMAEFIVLVLEQERRLR